MEQLQYIEFYVRNILLNNSLYYIIPEAHYDHTFAVTFLALCNTRIK
jgi:hypothetical protein